MMDLMSGLAKATAGADLAFEQVANQLQGAGVGCLFGVPGGGSNLALIDAAGRAGLPFVLTATETAGALAALAQAEATGRPGACLTTLGPGVASVVNGIAAAFLERAPLLVFTDSHPDRFAHQRLDHASLLGSITKWSATLAPDSASETVARAIEIAIASPPGPVHLDCPADVGSAGVPARCASVPTRAGTGTVSQPHATGSDVIRRLDLLLSRSRKPLLLVGLGARGADDAPAIRAMCEGCRVPAMVTYKAKGVIPDAHGWFAGVFTNAMMEQPLMDDSDLLIAIGLDPVELIPRPWTGRQPIVYCGPWPVDDRQVPFALQFVTSAAAAAEHLAAGLASSDWDSDRIRRTVDSQRRMIVAPQGSGLTAPQVVQIAAGMLAAQCRVAIDAGAHMFPATILWPAADPRDMLISNGLSTMGFALPAAIGAALADRRRRVVALTGDGGLLMCVGELQTAVRERLPITVIVFGDGSLSLIDVKQQQRGYRRAGVTIGPVDWPSLAASLGLRAFRAVNEAQLVQAIEAAAGDGAGPCLVEAQVDPTGYGALLRAVRG
jgi:acetolactate synthase-1/2/3 large subunit